MFVFHGIHMTLCILFPGVLLKKLGKFVTSLHSSKSFNDCFHTVLNIPCPIITPSIDSLFTWMAIHFCPVFVYEPLSYFIIFVVFSLCSVIAHCIFSTFPSYHIGFVCLPETFQMVSWFSEMKRLNSSAHGYHVLLVFWEMSVNLGCLQVPKLKGVITLLIFPNA